MTEYFEDKEVNFHYPKNLDEFNYLIEDFMQKKKKEKSEYVNNKLGEEMIIDKLIVR